ncbi:MAG: hypothetical protein ACXWUG_19565, partial [Polyangiales bacterium]
MRNARSTSLCALACTVMACASDEPPPAVAVSHERLWTQPANMKFPRTLHRATLIGGGKALITGGARAVVLPGFASLSAAEIYEDGR